MPKSYTNTVFRFEWTCTEANSPTTTANFAQYRLDCYPAGTDPIAVDSAHIVNCNYAAITALKCKWDYDDDLPIGLGTQANMEIEFDDELLPVDMSNMLTDEPVDITVPMELQEKGWNNKSAFFINVSDKEDYEEYIQNFTSDLVIKAGNIFILSVYDTTVTGEWRTLAAGMQKNSDTYEWDIKERKQSIKVTNLGRVVFETISTRWMRWLPVYCDAIERHMTYIDYLFAAEHDWMMGTQNYIYVGGTVAASTEAGNGLVTFLFCPTYKVEEFMLIMAKVIAKYYTRMASLPSATNLTLYNNQYYKQTYDDCTGVRGDFIGVPYTYMIAAVQSPYVEATPEFCRHPHFMYGGVCGEMENRYPSAWDYLSDSAKNRFVRELLKFDFTYPTDAQIALGVVNPSLAFEIKDRYYNSGTTETKTFKQSANMIYEPTLKVRDNVFNRVTAAAPDLCSQDISSVTARNPSSLSTREFNMPIIYNSLPGADEDGTADAIRRGRDSKHEQWFHINHLDEAFVRYSWATYHGWQQFYKDEPTCGLYGALTNNNDKVFIRVHEKMDFMITATIDSTTFYEPPDIDFSMVRTKYMDQTNYIYVQNNSGEPLIKANVFLKLFGSGRQSTLGGITRLNTFDWFDQTRAGIRVDFTEIAPAGNPTKFSELADYFVVSCAEIDVKAGYVEFKAYGLNYENK